MIIAIPIIFAAVLIGIPILIVLFVVLFLIMQFARIRATHLRNEFSEMERESTTLKGRSENNDDAYDIECKVIDEDEENSREQKHISK